MKNLIFAFCFISCTIFIVRSIRVLILMIRERKRREKFAKWCLHFYQQWEEVEKKPLLIEPMGGRLLIVSCDLHFVIGSKGDEALVLSIVENMPGCAVGCLTGSIEAEKLVQGHGWTPVPVASSKNSLTAMLAAVREFRPEFAVIMGADVMDGYYSPKVSMMQIAMRRLLPMLGVKTVLQAFSLNAQIHPEVIRSFQKLPAEMILNLRDAVSLERYEEATGRKGNLIADSAFMMKPNPDFNFYQRVQEWIAQHRMPVLAFNFSAMLYRKPTYWQLKKQEKLMATLMKKILDTTDWNLLLIPHDYREGGGDCAVLSHIAELLGEGYANRFILVQEKLGASQLKALVGLADALVSARMHLSIAMLSFGKPCCAFDYQGKFEGLYRHFDYSLDYLLQPPSEENLNYLYSYILDMMNKRERLQQKLTDKLPEVLALSRKNLDFASGENAQGRRERTD